MHRCLQIEEVLRIIFTNVDGYEYDARIPCPARVKRRRASSLRALASLARTCKTFKEPALKVLWRDIPDPYILIRYLMPEGLLRFDNEQYLLCFTQEPSESAWRRLDPYIPLIQIIGTTTPYDPPEPTPGRKVAPSPRIIRGLDPDSVLKPLELYLARRAQNPEVLFPNLVHVVYRAVWIHELYSRLLLSPQVQYLQFPMTSFASHWCLGEVRTFRCSMPLETYYPLLDHVPLAIMKMRGLHTIWLNSLLLDSVLLSHLGRLPTLTALALELRDDEAYPSRAVLDYKPFRGVRELFVSTSDAYYPSSFLAHIDPDALEAMTICSDVVHAEADDSAEIIYSVLAPLSPACRPTRVSVLLTEVEERLFADSLLTSPMFRPNSPQTIPWSPLQHDPSNEGDTDSDLHPAYTLEPESEYLFERPGSELPGLDDSEHRLWSVLSITSLQTFEVAIAVVFQLDDVFMSTLARCLPNLQTLTLVPSLRGPFTFEVDSSRTYQSLPHLDGLLNLVWSCLELKTLKIAVRGTFSDAWLADFWGMMEMLDQHSARAQVRTLELWTTALDERIPDACYARFLIRAFSFVRRVRVVMASNYTAGYSDEQCPRPHISRNLACKRWKTILAAFFVLRGLGVKSGVAETLRWSVE
ncbi:hypothetical protein C8Q77DRAFT_1125019 [Trametes polyzona]|nr:hypothetical protein C8Q77DRAFT_1125019 [Trametes polyzona]